MTRPFWMICRAPRHEHSKTEPTRRYASETQARTDAQALADQHGAPFVVLAVAATVHPRSAQDRLL